MKFSKVFSFMFLTALAFAAGAKAGVQYAKNHYVSRDRKFIEGKTTEE